jgi:hypothetical protein
VSFALSGFMVAHLLHTSMIQARRGCRGCSPRSRVSLRAAAGFAVVGAVAVAMACLAGHMQIAFYRAGLRVRVSRVAAAGDRRAQALHAWTLAWAGSGSASCSRRRSC